MSANHKFADKWWYKNRYKNVTKPNATAATNKIVHNPFLHGYHGFKLYFLSEPTVAIEITLKKILSFERYIERNSHFYVLATVRKNKTFLVDHSQLLTDDEFNRDWCDYKVDVMKNTKYTLSCMGVAMHQIIATDQQDSSEIVFDALLHARLINYEPILHLRNLKTNCFGILVSVCGTVIKASNTRQLLVTQITFQCFTCNGMQVIEQIDGNYTVPSKCLTKGCRAQSKFKPILDFPHTRSVNWQTIKIQELIGVDQYENGRVPRAVDCELTSDLVRCCIPGDDVTITGIIKSRDRLDNCTKKNEPSVFLMYIDVVAIVNKKNQANGSMEQITFNTKDYYAIQQIHAKPFLFRYLAQSLCPTIYGNEIVKAGLLLALFGGTHCERDTTTRSICHVLMVGDPGLGKSQMLLACANVAPRGVYICGNTSTSSGLTVTMTKESNGDYSLEAGALILADQGCCCIDEFDKMTQHNSLLEVMEQQSVSIAKAGVMCNLSTRTSIFAAGNPVSGHYDKAKTVAENLKISSPLISRFDLVFVLVDQPCEKYDKLVSERVLGVHSGFLKTSQTLNANVVGNTLSDRLKLIPGENFEYLDHVLLRKYIAYAQKYVHPVILPEAKEILKKFYLELRKYCAENNSSPITPRQLESMIRLTQARAKAELREEATADDAIEILEIMRTSFIDIFTDETGALDFRRSQSGSGMSKEKQVKALLSLIESKAVELTKNEFSKNEIKMLAEQVGIGKDRFCDVLEKLNFHGYLLKGAGNKYRLASM